MSIVDNLTTRRIRRGRPWPAAGAPAVILLALTISALTGCSVTASHRTAGAPSAAAVTLVRFNSCADALHNLRAAASQALAAGGFGAGTGTAARGTSGTGAASGSTAPALGAATGGGNSAAGAPAAPGSSTGQAGAGQTAGAAPGSYSSTTTATAGVDEPDIVKTDGRLIVTITGNVLRVVDAQTQQITGVLDLSAASQYGAGPAFAGQTPANLLLAGDHALVLFSQGPYAIGGSPANPGTGGPAGPPTPVPDVAFTGPRLALVDLAGTPQIIGEYTMDGALVDARQVGSVARVVIQSAPRIYNPSMEAPGAAGGLTPDQAAITGAGVSQWLPRYAVTTGSRWRTGLVDCSSVSHPAAAAYSGSSMLTVLTFDLSGTSLGDGEPVTIVADGDTVYSDGASLYIASRAWIAPVIGTASASAVTTSTAGPPLVDQPVAQPAPQYTAIYKFDISGPGRPVYEASGTVPGWLLGSSGTAEYSLSAWNGALRVATTTQGAFTAGAEPSPQSAVYVLEQNGDQLVVVGKAGGLGAGEQIYAVRFAGPVGYVVTFRQTDPLYTIDLSDPAQPRVVGQLLLNGYSAFLYPIDATHLIGIGQDTNAVGETTGTQISLFDVSDPAAPVRLAVYDLQFGHSEAEFDPHAFLYWAPSRLLVIPVELPYGVPPGSPLPTPVPQGSATASSGTASSGAASGGTASGGTTSDTAPYWPVSEAVVLQVGDSGFTELGTITHPVTPGYAYDGQIRRSLIVGNGLWTLSDAGLKETDPGTLAPLAWVPFSLPGGLG